MRLHTTLLACELLVSVTLACAPLAVFSAMQIRPNDAKYVSLKNDAHAACLCEQRNPSGWSACWARFDGALDRAGGQQAASACAPISTSHACLGDRCFVTIYRYVGPHRQIFCEQAQARMVESRFDEVAHHTGDPNRAVREADDLAQALAAGAKVTVAQRSGGCAG